MNRCAAAAGETGMIRLAAACLIWFALALAAIAEASLANLEQLQAEWDATARRVETVLGQGWVSTARLEELRNELARQRDEASKLNAAAIAIARPLRDRLDALGPAPADGAIEAPEIARLREELTRQIAQAEVPVKATETALRRAEDLIARIDKKARERFRDELLRLNPSPLSPSAIVRAAEDFATRIDSIVADAVTGVQRGDSRRLPALLLALAGIVILVAVRRRIIAWIENRLAQGLAEEAGRARFAAFFGALALSVSWLVIPGAGMALILLALETSGAAFGSAAPVIDDIGWLALCLVGAVWLAETLFGGNPVMQRHFALRPKAERVARRMTLLLGLVAGLDLLVMRGAMSGWLTLRTLSVLNLALLVIGGIALHRLGTALLRVPEPEPATVTGEEGEEEQAEPDPRIVLGRAIRRVAVGVMHLAAIAAPILAAIGFYALSRQIFYPVLFTTALLGVGIVIVALVSEAVNAATEGRPGRLQLLPVLAGFVLAIVSLPPLALVWGARESDLAETWRMLVEGVSIGEARISPADFLVFLIIFSIGYALTRLIKSLLRVTVLPQTRLDPGGQKAVVSIVGYVGIVVAALVAISAAGLNLSNLAIVAGALSVGIGFGLQTVVSNFVAGLILLIERPIKEGDWIKVGEIEGTVRRISVRSTVIQTFDRAVVTVPNADFMTSSVLNRTHSSNMGRVVIRVGVAYGSDTREVARILQEVAGECSLLLRRPAPKAVFTGFGADSLDFAVYCYLRDVNTTLDASSDIHHRIAERFAAEGIEIPFAQRDVHLRNVAELGEALRGSTGRSTRRG